MDEAAGISDVATGVESLTHAVSFPGEELIAVDAYDRPLGFATKEELHAGAGRRHRAFSVFLLDHRQRVLLHQRSLEKPLWPGFWTNSCCSHPRRGETLEGAVRRRLREELGVGATRLERIYAFDYRASFLDRGTEHEFCHVFLAQLDEEQRPTVHAAEIMDWAWYELTDVDALMKTSPDTLTPWFCLEWQMLRGRYASVLAGFAQGHSPRSAA